MTDTRLIHAIRARNVLSFSSDGIDLPLGSLNVLIGPNGSGKSNLLDLVDFMRSSPGDLQQAIRRAGGVSEWIWKGSTDSSSRAAASRVEVDVANPRGWSVAEGRLALRHRIEFAQVGGRFELVEEQLADAAPRPGYGEPRLYYRNGSGGAALRTVLRRAVPGDTATQPEEVDTNGDEHGSPTTYMQRETGLDVAQSILSQRKAPELYPELHTLAERYLDVAVYRVWDLGRNAAARRPQRADGEGGVLNENASNLALVIQNLGPSVRRRLLSELQSFYEPVRDLDTKISGGLVQAYLYEDGLMEPIPYSRVSDGTARYLCLLSILCHPLPPGLICLEEPELGLHPDVIPSLAKLLVEASGRTQLLVTTHSDELVSELSESPESVVVAERFSAGTAFRRLETASLQEWLETRSLGELWRGGYLGGNRW